MAGYGDFMGGRQNRYGQPEMGYDSGYRNRQQPNDWNRDRGGRTWTGYERTGEWRGRGGGDFNETWDATGNGFGRRDYRGPGYEPPRWQATDRSYGQYRPQPFGDAFPGRGGFRYDAGLRGERSRLGHDYDQDLGDRIRRGWNRIREEARDWMNRGYDRDW